MKRAFVLIDAVPKREQDVYDSLAKFDGIVARRLLPQRVGQGDILALVEGKDPDDLERIITSRLRSLNWVHSIIRIQPHHTLVGPVLGLMDEMAREADKRQP